MKVLSRVTPTTGITHFGIVGMLRAAAANNARAVPWLKSLMKIA